MGFSRTSLIARIAALDAVIDSKAAGADKTVKLGSFSISSSQDLKTLIKLQDHYIERLKLWGLPQRINSISDAINEFGVDNTEYISDD